MAFSSVAAAPGRQYHIHQSRALQLRAAWLLLVPLVCFLLGGGRSRAAAAGTPLCSIVDENTPTSLVCPLGNVVSSVDLAVFGTFINSSACPAPVAALACPTPVRAQVELLCVGRGNCSVRCFCDADLDPACRCSNADSGLVTGVPAFPCDGIAKQLGVVVACAAPVEPGFLSVDAPAAPATATAPSFPSSSSPATTAVAGLQLEFLDSPVLGLDELRPHLTWALMAGAAQTAFQIDVSLAAAPASQSSVAAAQLVWSSGRVQSSSPMHVPATALPLESDTAYSWTVSVFTAAGAAAVVSAPAQFITGLLAPRDWGDAEWIDAGTCTESPDLTTTGTCTGGLLRTEFVVPKVLLGRASLFVSACQYYELFIDGERVGDHELDVAWTRFERNRAYASYNLSTGLFAPGRHAIGLMVGGGFCGEADPPNTTTHRAALLSLRLHHADAAVQPPQPQQQQQLAGTTEPAVTVVTKAGGTWVRGQSPLTWDSAYFGEYYQSSLEQPGWAQAGFQPGTGAGAWEPAEAIVYSPAPRLSSQLMQPIRVVEEVTPYSSMRVLEAPGHSAFADPPRWTFDMGREMSGHVRLSLPAGVPPGTNFTLRHAEVLSHPPLPVQVGGTTTKQISAYDGSAYMGNLFWALPVDVFRSSPNASAGPQVYEARFTYHGFRYVELEASPPLPAALVAQVNVSTVTGVRVRSDTTGTGTGTDANSVAAGSAVRVANPLLQRVWDNSLGSEASALLSIPNGAAGRGERAGWTGDAAAASESELVDYNAAAFFVQYLRQVGDLACDADATVSNCIPESDPRRDGAGARPDPGTCSAETKDPSWSTVFPTIAHNLWRYFNATRAVVDQYAKLSLYMATLEADVVAAGGLGNILCEWGDWNPVVKTPCQITAATSYIHDLQRMADLAAALDKAGDAQHYAQQAAQQREAFEAAFYNATTGVYSTGTQMAQAAALWVGAVPAARLPATVAALADDVASRGITFGFLGVQYVFEALVRHNRTDAALACLLRTTDGYGHEVFNMYEPSTSLWESWDGDTMHQWLDESSRSHHYQASISTFFRKYVAGLDMPAGAAAWSVVRARPEAALLPPTLAAQVPAAAVRLGTPRGVVGVSWGRRAGLQRGSAGGPQAVRGVVLNVTVPTGASGEVHVPKVFGDRTVVLAGGTAVWAGAGAPGAACGGCAVEGVGPGEDDGRFVVFATAGGRTYSFEAVLDGGVNSAC